MVDRLQVIAALRAHGRGGEGERAQGEHGKGGGNAKRFLGLHGDSSLGLNGLAGAARALIPAGPPPSPPSARIPSPSKPPPSPPPPPPPRPPNPLPPTS